MQSSPLTPLHLGPAAAIGLLLRRRMHLPTFIVGNVALDLEPLAVIVFGLKHPIHGYFHTFLAALAAGLLLGLVMWLIERWLRGLYIGLYLEPRDYDASLPAYLIAGVAGWSLHVLLDSPLYPDIRPLYPYAANPLYAPWLYRWVNIACVVMIMAGLLMYIYVVIKEFPGKG